MINIADLDEICSRREHSTRRAGQGGSLAPQTVALSQPRQAAENAQGEIADNRNSPGRAPTEAARAIERALAYMFQNLDKPVQMPALGKVAGVSTSHFYHLFKVSTGFTPNDFFIRARMHRACGLLQETNLGVKQIAAALGYDDQFYFSRVFKSVSAVPPIRYRRLNLPLQREIKDSLAPKNLAVSPGSLLQAELGRRAVAVPAHRSFPSPTNKPHTTHPNSNHENELPINKIGRPVNGLDRCVRAACGASSRG